jgi:hypothetical protein
VANLYHRILAYLYENAAFNRPTGKDHNQHMADYHFSLIV